MFHREVQVGMRPSSSPARVEPPQEDDRGNAIVGPTTELRQLIERAAAGHPAECILLSGGLDTSILARLGVQNEMRAAVTVLVGPEAPDAPYAEAVADNLGLRHHVVRTDLDEILQEVEFVVRTLVTFDPMEIRNSIVVARGLREAAQLRYATVMTGDAADELFGGYSFMWSKPEGEFERFSAHLASVMRFSSIPLGAALGIEVKTPYLDPAVVACALRLSKAQKVGVRGGVTYGKFLLRLAFPEVEACWRRKDPIEVGAGTAVLPDYFRARILSLEFEAERERIGRLERVEIRDPEHLAYYRIFRQAFGDSPPLRRFGLDPCSKCGFELPLPNSEFCVTCGAWPARRAP